MALTPKQQQHASDISAESHLMRTLGATREQARRRLHEEARSMREETRKQQAQAEDRPAPTPPKIESDTTAFQPRPLTLGIDPATKNGGQGQLPAGGFSGNLTVCVDDGMGGFTQQTALFQDGILISVS